MVNTKDFIKKMLEEKEINEYSNVIELNNNVFCFEYNQKQMIEILCSMDKEIRKQIVNKMSQIDFLNGDVKHFINYIFAGYTQMLAEANAKETYAGQAKKVIREMEKENKKICESCGKEYNYEDEPQEVKQGDTHICSECWNDKADLEPISKQKKGSYPPQCIPQLCVKCGAEMENTGTDIMTCPNCGACGEYDSDTELVY